MIMPIVGNTDREFWQGRIYWGRMDRPRSVQTWWGQHGNWEHRSPPQEDMVCGLAGKFGVKHLMGLTHYFDSWTGKEIHS